MPCSTGTTVFLPMSRASQCTKVTSTVLYPEPPRKPSHNAYKTLFNTNQSKTISHDQSRTLETSNFPKQSSGNNSRAPWEITLKWKFSPAQKWPSTAVPSNEGRGIQNGPRPYCSLALQRRRTGTRRPLANPEFCVFPCVFPEPKHFQFNPNTYPNPKTNLKPQMNHLTTYKH